MDTRDTKKCISIINKDLGLDAGELLPEITEGGDELLEKHLTQIIQYLLDKDFGRLLNAMYRIDIPEDDFKQILETAAPNQLANTIAKRVIQRAHQKLIMRKKYSS